MKERKKERRGLEGGRGRMFLRGEQGKPTFEVPFIFPRNGLRRNRELSGKRNPEFPQAKFFAKKLVPGLRVLIHNRHSTEPTANPNSS